MNNLLVGSWKLDSSDESALKMYGDVSMEFKIDGGLIYTVHSSLKDGIMLLTHRIINDCIVTNQPSSSREEVTKFKFLSDDKLELYLGGERSCDHRI